MGSLYVLHATYSPSVKLGPRFTRAVLRDPKRPALTDEPDLALGQVVQLERDISIKITKRTKLGWDYSLRDDRPRLLHRNSSHGYTHVPSQAVHAEPEAVDEAAQRELTVRAHDRASRRFSEQDAEELRRKQERAVRDRLRETLRNLEPYAQQALLAKLERDIEEAGAVKEAA